MRTATRYLHRAGEWDLARLQFATFFAPGDQPTTAVTIWTPVRDSTRATSASIAPAAAAVRNPC